MAKLRKSQQGSIFLLVVGVIAIASVTLVVQTSERQRGMWRFQEIEALSKLHWALELLFVQAAEYIERGDVQQWPPQWQLPERLASSIEIDSQRELIPCPEGYQGDCYRVTMSLQGPMNTAVAGQRRFWGSEHCGAFGFDDDVN